MKDLETMIATLALLISLVSYWLSKKTSVSEIRPVLVFVYDKKSGWILKNVGNGPALNIIVAQSRNGNWFKPVRIPPLSTNGEFILKWLADMNDTGLGATYSDFENRPYSATCGDDLSRVFKGLKLRGFSEEEVGRHWDHP